jgi:hypothetical protein
MKIICAINDGNGKHISDKLICENINLLYGERIVTFFNDNYIGARGYNYDFYSLVEDDYKLKEI